MDPCAVSSQNGALARCLGSCALELGCAAAGGVQWPFFFFQRTAQRSQETPGCRCGGPWSDFQHLLNFTLAHAPDCDAGGHKHSQVFLLFVWISISISISIILYLSIYIYIHIISISISISIHFHQTHIGSGFLSKAPGLRRCFGSSLSGDFEPLPNCGQATGAFGDQESLWKCAQAAIFRGAGPGLMISIYSMIYI